MADQATSFSSMPFGAYLGRRPRETVDGEAWRVVQCEVCGAGAVVIRRHGRRPVFAHAMDRLGFTGLHCLSWQRGSMEVLRMIDGAPDLSWEMRVDLSAALQHGRAMKHWHHAAAYRELQRIVSSDSQKLAAAHAFRFPDPITFDRWIDAINNEPRS